MATKKSSTEKNATLENIEAQAGDQRPLAITAKGLRKWYPQPIIQKPKVHHDPVLLAKMRKMTCQDLGCTRFGDNRFLGGRKKKVTFTRIIKGNDMCGLPSLRCEYCRESWTPVDLGLMGEEEAIAVAKELRNG